MVLRRLSVLVVEDDYFIRDEISTILKTLGHTVVGEVANGETAVQEAQVLTPDIILMDIDLNGMNGMDAAFKIQTLRPTPIVFLTAYDSEEFIEKSIQSGASGYLLKPPKAGDIQRALLFAFARHEEVVASRNALQDQDQAIRNFEEELCKINEMKGLVSICCFCKKIRDENDKWINMETYISERLGTKFTHGICACCMKTKYNLSQP